jgi:hypothetical protein
MPKRLVFIEVDQEGKPVVTDETVDRYAEAVADGFFGKTERGIRSILSSLPSASEALVEEIADELDIAPSGSPTSYDRARALLARVEGRQVRASSSLPPGGE